MAKRRTLGRNMRSKCRCSMCPAIHINSRSWLRSSSTHEPSDPPPKVVFHFAFAFSGDLSVRPRQLVKRSAPSKLKSNEMEWKEKQKAWAAPPIRTTGLFKPSPGHREVCEPQLPPQNCRRLHRGRRRLPQKRASPESDSPMS